MKLLKYGYSVGNRHTYYAYSDQARRDYYIARSDIRSHKDLQNKLNDTGSVADSYYYTADAIKPFDVPFSSGIKESIKILGKPTYVLENERIDTHTVVFYKKRVDSFRYLLQLHYIDNQLVFAMNHIYENTPLTQRHLLEMTRLLLFKYTHKSQDELSNIGITVVDSKENRITVSDTLGFNIRYSTGNAFVRARIMNLMENKTHQTLKKKLMQRAAMLNFL